MSNTFAGLKKGEPRITSVLTLRVFICPLNRKQCRFGIRDIPEEQVTDNHLDRYLKKVLKPKYKIVDTEGAFRKSLKLDLTIPDANARVMQLFIDFDDIAEKQVLTEIFKDEPGQKLKATNALRPEVLKNMATFALKHKYRDARKDDQALFDVLVHIVQNQEDDHQASKQATDKFKQYGGDRKNSKKDE